MREKKYIAIGVFILILFLPLFVHSKSHYRYIKSPKTDFYFGYISYTEVKNDGKDPVVMREGEKQPEVAVLNFPLAPGDTILTSESRRCEIQFDTGTIIRLDVATELKIETILAKSLSTSKEISNFLLNKGEIYVMYKRYSLPEIFQVVTPNAAVKLRHNTVAMISAREDGSTDIQVKYGKAEVLFGPEEDSLQSQILKKSEKLTISAVHKALQGEYKEDADFELWNENLNENFKELHEGKVSLPAPIQRLPEAVFYFAQRYSNFYGEWIWNNLYGYVWRPYYNDYYPSGTWQPYIYGQWRELNGELFWVPMETWGWVPYHLGFWQWDEKLGWLWIPGSLFAPAWVDWDFFFGYYTWWPWSPMDWLYLGYYPYYYTGYYGYYYPYYYWYNPPGVPGEGGKNVLTVIRKDQLKKHMASPQPLPKELKKVCNNILTALEKGDQEVLAPLKKISEQRVMVKKEDLNAVRIQEKIKKAGEIQLPKQKESVPPKTFRNPYRDAVKTFKQNNLRAYVGKALELTWGKKATMDISLAPKIEKRTSLDRAQQQEAREKIGDMKGEIGKQRMVPVEKGALARRGEQNAPYAPISPRRVSPLNFRDWNPDSRVARQAGVSIQYVSRSNEIRCPELRLSSNTVHGSHNMAVMTGISPSGGGSYSGSGASSSSGSSGAKSSGSSSSQKGGSSHGGGSHGGGTKKNN